MKRINIDKIAFKNLSHGYPEKGLILDHVTIDFPKYTPLIIHGPVGSGRSTLLKILIGLEAASTGEYLINDQVVNDYSYKEFEPLRLNMGISQEQSGLLSNMSLFDNLKLPLDFHSDLSLAEKKDYLESLFYLFGLENQMQMRPMFTTAGTRKVVALLRSLVLKPQVLFLNNPTQSLHLQHQPIFLNLIQQHQQKHDLKFMFYVTDDEHFYQHLPYQIVNLVNQKLIIDHPQRKASHEI